MDSLQWALSWLIVLAVGLAPILLYWAGRVLLRAFRRKGQSAIGGRAPVETEEESAQASDAAPPT